MKGTRKKEYAEKRIRKSTAKEISDRKVSEHHERTKDNKPQYIKVAPGLWKEVKKVS
jgi:hypothetical protein